MRLTAGSPSPSFQSQTLACCLLLATSRRVARESTNTTSSVQMEPKSNHNISYPFSSLSATDPDWVPLPGKRKTDLERSVSLLTPHYPSDHVQVAVQRPPESSVSTLSVLLCLLCSFSRWGRFESLVRYCGEASDAYAGERPGVLTRWGRWMTGWVNVAAEPGIEPGLRDPNSPVLPLHHSAAPDDRCWGQDTSHRVSSQHGNYLV